MFCQKCGKEIPDGSVFCSGCGAHVDFAHSPGSSFNSYVNRVSEETRKYNVWAIVSFAVAIASFWLPGLFAIVTGIASIVMSIYALNQIKATEEKGIVFAILVIVFGATFMLYGIICALVIFGLLGAYGSVLGYYLNLL